MLPQLSPPMIARISAMRSITCICFHLLCCVLPVSMPRRAKKDSAADKTSVRPTPFALYILRARRYNTITAYPIDFRSLEATAHIFIPRPCFWRTVFSPPSFFLRAPDFAAFCAICGLFLCCKTQDMEGVLCSFPTIAAARPAAASCIWRWTRSRRARSSRGRIFPRRSSRSSRAASPSTACSAR